MSSLRIAVFVGTFPVASETFILRQITGLIDLGHQVHIFANERGDIGIGHAALTKYALLEKTTFVAGPAESIAWEMPVLPLRGDTWMPGAERPISNLRRAASALPLLLASAAASPQLTRFVLDPQQYSYRARSLSGLYRLAALRQGPQHFDVLHAHFGPVANAFRFARRYFSAPFVASFHGYDFSTIPRKEGKNVYARLFETADAITANSDYTAQQLQALGCPASLIARLPVGFDPAHFPFCARTLAPGEPARLLTVARLVPIKGHEYVLRALALLRDRGTAFAYDIVGDGPLREKLAGLTRELKLEQQVTFHGSKTEEQVGQFLAGAHLFLLCSVTTEGDQEGQGLVLQEAQASGLPVIATRHGAFPEGIAPENQPWIVPEGDIGALASTIAGALLATYRPPAPGAAAARLMAAREFVVQRYAMSLLNGQLAGIYAEAIKRFQP